MNLTDQQIAWRARAGDVAAYVQLVERYRAPLISYLLAIAGQRDQAEELAQEAFCRVWEKRASLRSGDALVSWLYKIAHNLAVSAARRPKLAPLPTEVDLRSQLSRSGTGDSSDPHPDLLLAIHRTVAQLPPPLRTVVSLKHFSAMSHEEIATALSIPQGTVRSRLSRAYERLRPMLKHLVET